MRRTLGTVGLASVLACAACVPQGLSFRVDNRVKIISPRRDATLSLPFTLRWTVKNFHVVQPGSPSDASAGYFAVFIDATPMRPGQKLDAIAKGDVTCQRVAGCPNASYYAGRGIYTTTNTQFVVSKLPDASTGKAHRATIVLLNSAGRRIGESAFRVDFQLKEDKS